MEDKGVSHPQQSMSVVYLTVATSIIGMSLPFPVFSQLFLQSDVLLDADASIMQRTNLLGLALALFPFGQMISAPFWGWLSDHWSRKSALMTALLVTCLGMMIVSWSINHHHLYGLLAGRLIAGLGEGNIAIAQAMATDGYDRRSRMRHFAGIAIATNIAWMLGPVLGGILGDRHLSHHFDTSVPFELAAGMYVINMLVVKLFIKETDHRRCHDRRVTSKTFVWRQLPIIRLMLMCLIIFLAIHLKFLYFSPLMLIRFDFSIFQMGVCTALFSLPMLFAGVIAEPLNQKLGGSSFLLLSITLLVAGLASLMLANNLLLLIVPSILIGFGFIFSEVVTALMVSDLADAESQGKMMGIYRSTLVLSEILAALMGGWLAGISINYPFLLGIALLLCILPVVVLATKKTSGK